MTNRIAVLVVEDEVLVLLDIVYQLEAEGFKVYQAHNAEIAIELLIAHLDIRLVFTDIDMPGSMNGLTLATAVSIRWPPVKIIVTSGHHLVDIKELPAGIAFFPKPYAHLSVLASMREMLAA